MARSHVLLSPTSPSGALLLYQPSSCQLERGECKLNRRRGMARAAWNFAGDQIAELYEPRCRMQGRAAPTSCLVWWYVLMGWMEGFGCERWRAEWKCLGGELVERRQWPKQYRALAATLLPEILLRRRLRLLSWTRILSVAGGNFRSNLSRLTPYLPELWGDRVASPSRLWTVYLERLEPR